MRLRSARVACGLARASSGSANAMVQLARHLSSSAGYTPCSRHQALLAASFMAAVVTTASNRAPAVQARPRAGLDCASSRQRSRVPAPTPTSRATNSSAALSGGSNLATALSLNACPYRATLILHRRPPGSWFYGGDNYSDAGGCSGRALADAFRQRNYYSVELTKYPPPAVPTIPGPPLFSSLLSRAMEYIPNARCTNILSSWLFRSRPVRVWNLVNR